MATTSVRLSLPLEDRALLTELARKGDRTLSATVRLLVRGEADRQGIVIQPPGAGQGRQLPLALE